MSKKNESAPELLSSQDVDTWICDLISFIRNADDPDLVFGFFKQVFSEKELFDIANRLVLLTMLDEGVVQREIARRLGISLCKITRGSAELKRPNSAIKRGLAIFKKMKQ